MTLSNEYSKYADEFTLSILADPITKQPVDADQFSLEDGVIDARVFLKNTLGYKDWKQGQIAYEAWESKPTGSKNALETYLKEIKYDRPIYEHFTMTGKVLDVGGGVGTVRQFLEEDTKFVSVDPFVSVLKTITPERIEAYTCLERPLNFLSAMAEFLPFTRESFDWVHMRSMLDHVQVPDLVMNEVHRVLVPGGRVLIGLMVEGGKTGKMSLKQHAKEIARTLLVAIGIERYKDHHVWHPTYGNLRKLIEDNGFEIEDVYWQPYWKDQVCYVKAKKQG